MAVMTVRQRKRLLWLSNITLCMLVIWSVYALAIAPIDVNGSSGDGSRGTAKGDESTVRQLKLAPVSEFAVIYDRNLRKAVRDREAAPPTVKPKIPLLLKLEGMAVEDGNNLAFLRTKGGEFIWAGVGQIVDDAKILKVVPGQVTVLFHGREIVLTTKKQGGS